MMIIGVDYPPSFQTMAFSWKRLVRVVNSGCPSHVQ